MPAHFFGSGSHVLRLPFRPYALEILITLECLLLGETYRATCAFKEGPMPHLLLFAPWNSHLPNSPIFPHQQSPFISFSTFWYDFLRLLYSKSQVSPLSLPLLFNLKRDLLILIERSTNHTLTCSHHAEILLSYEFQHPTLLTSITVCRPYFEIIPPPISLGDHWTRLREHFDDKRSHMPPWSLSSYLKLHSQSHQQYLSRQRSSPPSSD